MQNVILQNVFIEEQGVPEDEIFDGKTNQAIHVVILENDLPVATTRIMKEAERISY